MADEPVKVTVNASFLWEIRSMALSIKDPVAVYHEDPDELLKGIIRTQQEAGEKIADLISSRIG